MDEAEKFSHEVEANVSRIGADADVQALSRIWVREIARYNYAYNFLWFGRPIIQFPQDVIATQEIIWRVKPDLIIETGIAHGGSIIMSASMLAMLDYCDAIHSGQLLDPRSPSRRVLAVDVDIRAHNRSAIESHPLSNLIDMIEGSSIASDVVTEVHRRAHQFKRILVLLDSSHTHEHVLAELEAYAPLVSLQSYCVVFDTLIEWMPTDIGPSRPWSSGNSPMTAVNRFLEKLESESIVASDGRRLSLEVDTKIDSKLLISAAPHGFLRRVT